MQSPRSSTSDPGPRCAGSYTRPSRWKLTVTILTCVASLVGAVTGIIALRHSAHADRVTQQLSQQSLALQKQEYRAQNVQLVLRPWIQLDVDQRIVGTYPDDLPRGSRDVPVEQLNTATTIWLVGDLSNTGGREINIRQWALGLSGDAWLPAGKDNGLECAVGGDLSHWTPCAYPYELAPNREVEFGFTTTVATLNRVDPAWRQRGLELCIGMEAFGSYCATTTARVFAAATTPPASR